MLPRKTAVRFLHMTVLVLLSILVGRTERASASATDSVPAVCTTAACTSPCFCRHNEASAGCRLHVECVCIAEE